MYEVEFPYSLWVFVLFYTYVHHMYAGLSVCDTVCMQYLQGLEEGVGSFGTGVIGGCVPPKEGAGN